MKCGNCPLYRYWNNEYDKGESCGLFGDGWDNSLQYEDKEGTVIGCYVDKHYIKKIDDEYMKDIAQEAEGYKELWKEEG